MSILKMLVCVFDLIRIPERKERDMFALTLVFLIFIAVTVWTFFNGYPSDAVSFALLGLIVLLWCVQEIEWKRTR